MANKRKSPEMHMFDVKKSDPPSNDFLKVVYNLIDRKYKETNESANINFITFHLSLRRALRYLISEGYVEEKHAGAFFRPGERAWVDEEKQEEKPVSSITEPSPIVAHSDSLTFPHVETRASTKCLDCHGELLSANPDCQMCDDKVVPMIACATPEIKKH